MKDFRYYSPTMDRHLYEEKVRVEEEQLFLLEDEDYEKESISVICGGRSRTRSLR